MNIQSNTCIISGQTRKNMYLLMYYPQNFSQVYLGKSKQEAFSVYTKKSKFWKLVNIYNITKMQCLTLVYVSDISSCVFCVCRHTHTTQVKLISYRFVYNKQQKYNLPRTYASLQCVHIYNKRDNKVLSIKYLLDTYLYDTHILLNENPC